MTAYLRPAGGLALLGLLVWTTAEALNEALVYKHCRRSALDAHCENFELRGLNAIPVQSRPQCLIIGWLWKRLPQMLS